MPILPVNSIKSKWRSGLGIHQDAAQSTVSSSGFRLHCLSGILYPQSGLSPTRWHSRLEPTKSRYRVPFRFLLIGFFLEVRWYA